MSGIQFLTDEKGNTTAIQIDIRKRPEIWEDIQDVMLSKERLKDEFEPIETLYARLQKKTKRSPRTAPSRRLTRNVSR